MGVAAFGATCSPAIAQHVKITNAKGFEQERAVEGIIFSHYVNDYLDSFPTEEEAKQVEAEIRDIHRSGDFQLRNWCTNRAGILRHLKETVQKQEKQLCFDDQEQSERVLMMRWITETD